MNEIEIANGTKDVQSNYRWFIAQYNDPASNFNAVQAIIRQDLITRVKDNLSQENLENAMGQQICIRTATNIYRLGHLIYVAESYSDAWHQLRKLKMICFQMIYARPIMNLKPHCHEWMLVQYESEFNCITYSIVNTDVAVIEEKNTLYDNIVTKIKINNNEQHSAAIIRMSNDTEELIEALNFMKQKCIDSNALNAMMPILTSQNNAGEAQVTVETDAPSQLINEMELTMHAQCRTLVDAFDKIREIRMNMQRREYNLNMTQLLYNVD